MSFRSVQWFRVVLVVLGVLGAMFALPWVPLLSMVVLSIRYRAWEVPALGLLVDLLWFTPSGVEGLSSLPLFTLAGLALMWGFEPLRREFLIGA